MAKKRKIEKKLVVKFPETESLDPQYINPIKSSSDYTINNIKSVILNSRYIQLLILITFIGFFLRFYNLAFNSLWLDEASTLNFITADGAGGSYLEIWAYTLPFDPNPPLFIWIEYTIMKLFGVSEFILRFAPALFGAITIPIMYFVGKEFLDENGGIIAATAFALSPFLVLYSQEARSYSMLLFFVTLTMYLYLKAMRTDGLKYWILFSITASLSFLTHFYSGIFIAALMIYTLLMFKMKYFKELAISFIIISITAVPATIIALKAILDHAAYGPAFGVTGFNVVYQTLLQISGYNIVSMYLLLFLFICGFVILYLNNKEKSYFMMWMFGVTFIISMYLSYKLAMVPRYLSFLSIILFLGVAASYKLFYKLTKNKVVIYSILIMLVAINTPFLLDYYSNYSKDDWRGFSKTLSGMTNAGDQVIVVPGYMRQPLNYYYLNNTDGTTEYLADNESALITFRTLQTKNSYYVVTGDIQSKDPTGRAIKWLEANTKQVYQSGGIFIFKS